MKYREVARGTIEVDYIITEYDMYDGTFTYDWKTDNAGSDELFHSLQAAERDVRNHF